MDSALVKRRQAPLRQGRGTVPFRSHWLRVILWAPDGYGSATVPWFGTFSRRFERCQHRRVRRDAESTLPTPSSTWLMCSTTSPWCSHAAPDDPGVGHQMMPEASSAADSGRVSSPCFGEAYVSCFGEASIAAPDDPGVGHQMMPEASSAADSGRVGSPCFGEAYVPCFGEA